MVCSFCRKYGWHGSELWGSAPPGTKSKNNGKKGKEGKKQKGTAGALSAASGGFDFAIDTAWMGIELGIDFEKMDAQERWSTSRHDIQGELKMD